MCKVTWVDQNWRPFAQFPRFALCASSRPHTASQFSASNTKKSCLPWTTLQKRLCYVLEGFNLYLCEQIIRAWCYIVNLFIFQRINEEVRNWYLTTRREGGSNPTTWQQVQNRTSMVSGHPYFFASLGNRCGHGGSCEKRGYIVTEYYNST